MQTARLILLTRLKFSVLVQALTLLIATSTAGFASDFNTGLRAFRAGDYPLAFNIWHPLARAGQANAQHAIGAMYEYGHGLVRDDAEALIWYGKAAAQDMADSQYRLGVLTENGWGVPRDPVAAAKWYSLAAEAGHVLAQHDLAFLYYEGKGVPQNVVQAYKWLKIASAIRADLMAKHLAYVSEDLDATQKATGDLLANAWFQAHQP